MPTIDQLKEVQAPPTPLYLFDCTLQNGSVERWGTHAVTFNGNNYDARILKHNLFELAAAPEDTKISVTLANADSRFSEIERETGFRGAQVTVQLLFYDLTAQQAASEARIIFRGIGNTAEETTEAALRVTFTNRLNLQRIVLPEVRIQRRCPWTFPATSDQRVEAVNGGAKRKIFGALSLRILARSDRRRGHTGLLERRAAVHNLRLHATDVHGAGDVRHRTIRRNRVRAGADRGAKLWGIRVASFSDYRERDSIQRFCSAGVRHGVVSAAGSLREERRQPDAHGSAVGDGGDRGDFEGRRQRRRSSRGRQRRRHDRDRLVQPGYERHAIGIVQSGFSGRRSVRQHGDG